MNEHVMMVKLKGKVLGVGEKWTNRSIPGRCNPRKHFKYVNR